MLRRFSGGHRPPATFGHPSGMRWSRKRVGLPTMRWHTAVICVRPDVLCRGPGGPLENSRGPVAPGSGSPFVPASREGRMKAVAHRPGVRRPTCVTPCHFQASLRDEVDVAPAFPGATGPRLRSAIPPGCVGPGNVLASQRCVGTLPSSAYDPMCCVGGPEGPWKIAGGRWPPDQGHPLCPRPGRDA